MRHQLAPGLAVLAIALASGAQQPVPVGTQFQVNSYTTKRQIRPAVAVEPAGDFVVVPPEMTRCQGESRQLTSKGSIGLLQNLFRFKGTARHAEREALLDLVGGFKP